MSGLRRVGMWTPAVGLMALIWVLSSRSVLPGLDRIHDKVLHLGAYTLLGLLSLRAAHGGLDSPRLWPSAVATVLTIVYGLVDEIHQSRVPGRQASGLDWFADITGAGLALGVFAGLAAFVPRASARRDRS